MQLSLFSDGLALLPEAGDMSDAFWARVMEVKTAVNKALEAKRNEKLIGSGLGAEVTLFCDAELSTLLSRLQDELRFVLMVSQASLQSLDKAGDASETDVPGLRLSIAATGNAKCVRCWHHRPDVGNNAAHPELCARCVENIEGQGEKRLYA